MFWPRGSKWQSVPPSKAINRFDFSIEDDEFEEMAEEHAGQYLMGTEDVSVLGEVSKCSEGERALPYRSVY